MARGKSLIRQWNLLKALQTHHFGLSSSELSELLRCSKRQILRDINILQEAGFPIEFDVRDYGKRYWKLSSHFIEREELMLTMTELLSLYISQQLLAPLSGTLLGSGLSSALEKIKALLPASALNYFEELNITVLVKRFIYDEASIQNKQLRIINDAILLERVLKLTYKSAQSGKVRHYDFHPYGLIFMGASLYCTGYIEQYSEVRTLKFERIIEIENSNRHFNKPSAFSLRREMESSFGIMTSGKPQIIKVKFTGWAATNIREHKWHSSQEIIKDKDDYLIASFTLTNTIEFKRWILGFGQYATILTPKKLKMQIIDELSSTLKNYQNQSPAEK